MKSFSQEVFKIVKKIPRGKTLSYSDVAYKAGFPGAARAVGNLLRQNTDIIIPCHRVIRADGKLGFYNGLLGKTKQEILKDEGFL
jgi:methylated-DNA-[protein]-cysteine S-methyltransferase